jgi:nuclear pore complex protein Nup107
MLANTVADSRYELYDAFQNPYGNRLGEYLQCVKEAVLGGLEGGSSDPFRVVAA